MKCQILGPHPNGTTYSTPFGVVHTDKNGIGSLNQKQFECLSRNPRLTVKILDEPAESVKRPRRRKEQ